LYFWEEGIWEDMSEDYLIFQMNSKVAKISLQNRIKRLNQTKNPERQKYFHERNPRYSWFALLIVSLAASVFRFTSILIDFSYSYFCRQFSCLQLAWKQQHLC